MTILSLLHLSVPMFANRNDFPHPLRSSSFISLRTALFSEQIGVCRICLEETDSRRLLQPCKCRGTQAYVHQQCLERWLIQKRNRMCEICLGVYERESWQFKPISLWTWPRPASDGWEDRAEFVMSIVWLLIASKVCHCWFSGGIAKFHSDLHDFLGSKNMVTFWWFSLITNSIFYPFVLVDVCWRWWNDNTVYTWRQNTLMAGEENPLNRLETK